MKVTLQVHGREMTFSEQQLSFILEKYFSNEDKKVPKSKVAQKPTEDAWFEVKPQTIDQKLFQNKRKDKNQEEIRKWILEAFLEMKNNPKYGRNFKTMMPKKEWKLKTAGGLKELACKLGDHNANWVEQAFEWAQQISNGESWESVCNNPDTANWHRLVVWKDGYNRIIGGSVYERHPASNVNCNICTDDDILKSTVPLVVSFEY